MAGFHTNVRLINYPFEDSQITVNLAAGITATHIGLALTQDTSAANTMKLAGDGDPIMGQLYTVENRVIEGHLVGVCAFRFAEKMTIAAGLTGAAVVAIGSKLVGAGAGTVKAIDLTGTPTTANCLLAAGAPRVWAVSGLVADATKF